MKSITVVIPTYNRFDCIKNIIEQCFAPYSGDLFTFEIHDSSNTSEVAEYVAALSDNRIKYLRYPSDLNGDKKTMQAICNVTTPYYFLLGDGLLVDFNALESYLLKISFEKYNVIGFRSPFELNGKVGEYYDLNSDFAGCGDCVEYFQKYFWLLTLYGSSIAKTDLIKNARNLSQKYIDIVSPFMYVCTLFEGLLLTQGSCSFGFVDFISPNPYKKNSGWIASRQAIEFFCYRYYESVKLLPDCYNAMTRDFLIRHNTLSTLFEFRSILNLRIDGNVSFAIVKKYRFYIRKTVRRPSYLYWSLLFPKFLLRALLKIHKKLKKK